MIVSYSYNWLKEYVGEKLPNVEELTKLITFHAFEVEEVTEVRDDTRIDLKILPDRGSDALSHYGLAREIVAILGTSLVSDPLSLQVDFPVSDKLRIEIANETDCPRFMLAHFKGVKIGPSPDWLQARLETIGQRSINNVVDATNYVMYAVGQPMHAYDGSMLETGNVEFGVRRARIDETIALLPEGGVKEVRNIKLNGEELLIVDGESDAPIGLAGIKGGEYAKLQDGSTEIVVEAANFHPTLIRKTAEKVGIVTDASRRFENGIVREMPEYAVALISKILAEIAGAELVGVVDKHSPRPVALPIKLSLAKINGLLGLSLSETEVIAILNRLQIKTEVSEGLILATPPFVRTDLRIQEDLIEEIGRLNGLTHIESSLPEMIPVLELNKKFYYGEQIREILLNLGFSEVITTSFLAEAEVKLASSLASDKSCLRPNLSIVLKTVLEKNVQNIEILGLRSVKIFEIGSVFKLKAGKAIEEIHLALGVRTKKVGTNKDDERLVNEAVAELKKAGLDCDFIIEGGVAETSLESFFVNQAVPEAYLPVAPGREFTYKVFSVFPAITRDVALWVKDSVLAESIKTQIETEAGSLLLRADLFDEFAKEGRTSYAFRLVFQANDRTLTDGEVEPLMKKVYEKLTTSGYEIR